MTTELPFTDNNLEDKAKKDKCDELATLEVQNNSTFWGRWFLEDRMLCTWICSPKSQTMSASKMVPPYSISLDKLDTPEKRQDFYDVISKKQWIGSRGLKDLQRVLISIGKHGRKIVSD